MASKPHPRLEAGAGTEEKRRPGLVLGQIRPLSESLMAEGVRVGEIAERIGVSPVFSDHGPARLQLIAIAGRQVLQGVPHLTDHAVPVAGTGLTKLSQGRVPRTVVAVQ
jgi:hypothetical protein